MFLMLGFMYMWSNFQPYIQADLGFVSDGSVKWAYTMCVVCFSLGIMLDGMLGKYLSPTKSVLLGTILSSVGFIASSVLTPNFNALIYVTYGLCVGLGIGFSYSAWLTNVLSRFPDKRGLASGILLLGMGMTGLTLMKFVVAPWLAAEGLGWRFSFRVIGIAMLVIGVVSLLFMKSLEPPQNADNKPNVAPEEGLTTKQMLKTGVFWYFIGWRAVLFGVGLSVTGAVLGIVLAGAPVSSGMDEAALLAAGTNAVAVFSICNGASRPAAGIVFDKLKAIKTMSLVGALLAISSAILFFSYGNSLVITIVALSLIAVCYGSSTSLAPSFTSEVFGQTHYRNNFGIQSLAIIPFTILGSQGISAVYDATDSYKGFFMIMIVCGGAALAFALLCRPGINRLQEQKGISPERNQAN